MRANGRSFLRDPEIIDRSRPRAKRPRFPRSIDSEKPGLSRAMAQVINLLDQM